MRVPMAAVVMLGALLIAASIMVTGRYSIGKVEVYKDDIGIVYGLDNWTGRAFAERRQP